jgi:Caspase domain
VNWAVVIGVDRYWSKHASLKGAVRDALRMREWLLDPHGGNVPEQNIALILSPNAGSDPGVKAPEATRDAIITSIADLLKLSKGEGERLYFFYAGHGLTARVNQRDENALVCADFSDVLTTNSLALRSLWEFFETVQFQDQFFFVDACRNIPWENVEFEVGRWPLPRKRDPGLPPAQQFILYATSPGLRAQELTEAGNERGAFTDVLLDGVRGSGKSKAWSSEAQNYQVRWERLVDYVKGELEERRLEVGQGPAQEVFQIPQDAGARGVAGRERNPALAEFAADAFPDETLRIRLTPEEVVSVAAVTVLDETAEPVATKEQIPGLPVEFSLPPRTYALHATAPEYDKAVARPPVELYAPCEIPLGLTRAQPVESPNGGDGAATRGLENARAKLMIQTSDPLAPIEVADQAGQVLEVSAGRVSLLDLDPGFYRVRLVVPGSPTGEQLVELGPGEEETVHLEAPAAAEPVQDLVETIGAPVHDDNTVEASTSAGPIAAPELSTILTLAAGAALTGGVEEAESLTRLGLGEARKTLDAAAESGLYVVVGHASTDADATKQYFDGLKLRFWQIGQPVPQSASSAQVCAGAPAVAEFAASAEANAYWFSLQAPGAKPIVVALALLPKRLTLLTIEVQPELTKIFQYLPSLAPDTTASGDVLRRIELLERVLLDGRLDAGHEVAQGLLARQLANPLAGCLAGYFYLRAGRANELESAAKNLTTRFPGLSDVHVIKGEFEAAAGHPAEAKAAFATAVEIGLPIFGEGLTRLLEGVRTYEIEHPRVKLVRLIFERHMSGSMWSAWVPEESTPGELLVP